MSQVINFIKNDITPIYIFDGKATEDKAALLKQRRETYTKNKTEYNKIMLEAKHEDITDMKQEKADKLKKVQIKITQQEITNLKKLFDMMGVRYYQCNGETDLFCRYLSEKKIVKYFITEDMDFITHGCKYVLTKFSFYKPFFMYDSDKIYSKLELNRQKFIDICILLGCDYTGTITGIGQVGAVNLVKKHGSIEKILESTSFKQDGCDFEMARNMFTVLIPVDEFNPKIKIGKMDYKELKEYTDIHKMGRNYEKALELKNTKVTRVRDLSTFFKK